MSTIPRSFRNIAPVCLCIWACPTLLIGQESSGQSKLIETRLVHLRSGALREWSEFPESPQSAQLSLHFDAKRNEGEFALRLRQQDVKQGWNVSLNGKRLGELVRDENDMIGYLPVPPSGLVDGDNSLSIEPQSKNAQTSDDIRVGQLRIESRAVNDILNEGTVEVLVTEAGDNKPVPCRITIVDMNGSLQTVGAASTEQLAVRTGTIYTSRGVAKFGLPAGRYTVYAGRGFEYSLEKREFSILPGQTIRQSLAIQRQVPTDGYVACDTHVHTLTHSGHGDSTITERMITLAGEGIELPIATDHNVHIDYEPLAQQLQLRQYFTPVIGNEVTTSVGHFNVFPVAAEARDKKPGEPGGVSPRTTRVRETGEPGGVSPRMTRIPDFRKNDWAQIFEEIFQTPGVRVAILNHARDLHSGVRPFGPKLFNAAIGENVHGWPMRFNAMEVVNSSAVQTDDLQLFRDWMALLNRGYMVTPVGSSDSHDVSRHFVGQGRTYIRTDDRDPGNIDVADAVTKFLQGRVLVSYGLIAELTIAGKFRSGDLVPLSAIAGSEASLPVELRVLGPQWIRSNRLLLYMNGTLVREESLPDERDGKLPSGVHWQQTWKIPRPSHDVHLVAIALGPGIGGAYWKTAKPYQPTSPNWTSQVIGCSGAVWFDGDGDGQRSSAKSYADKAYSGTNGDLSKLIANLQPFDAATAAQAIHLFRVGGGSLESDEFSRALNNATPAVRAGFGSYVKAWRDNELAK